MALIKRNFGIRLKIISNRSLVTSLGRKNPLVASRVGSWLRRPGFDSSYLQTLFTNSRTSNLSCAAWGNTRLKYRPVRDKKICQQANLVSFSLYAWCPSESTYQQLSTNCPLNPPPPQDIFKDPIPPNQHNWGSFLTKSYKAYEGK